MNDAAVEVVDALGEVRSVEQFEERYCHAAAGGEGTSCVADGEGLWQLGEPRYGAARGVGCEVDTVGDAKQ